MSKKRSGFIVETKDKKIGKRFNDEEPVNGKLRVYLEDGTKILCPQGTLIVKGFFD